MSTPLYSYSPRPGQVVSVGIDGSGDGCPIVAVQPRPGHRVEISIPDVFTAEVALGFFRAMRDAAGLPVASVLDQVPDRTFADWTQIQDQMVLLDIRGPLSFESARRFAATLVAEVERAENEPDPAEVEALAGAIERDERASGGRPDKWAERAARAVLARWTLTERKPGGGGHG
jgi:hypothetical protein